VALVGAPNVGKSALFNRLTGSYVAVSNYPGTTVEVARGHGTFADRPVEVVDTPGMYSLLATTEEERVAGRVVLDGEAGVLVHVVDAKNLPRLLPLTLQLIETGQPVVLALNMMDEAERLGWRVDADRLAARLGIAVAPIVAVEGRGIADLAAAVVRAADAPIPPPPPYGNGVGAAILALRETLRGEYPVDRAAIAALLLQGDAATAHRVRGAEPDGGRAVLAAVGHAQAGFGAPGVYRVAVERQGAAESCLDGVIAEATPPAASSALGILPGGAVELTQRFPAFVFRIGHAEFATDAELAERVRVRRRWGTNQPEAWTVPHAVIK